MCVQVIALIAYLVQIQSVSGPYLIAAPGCVPLIMSWNEISHTASEMHSSASYGPAGKELSSTHMIRQPTGLWCHTGTQRLHASAQS
jgi:hypothetical protein